MTTVTWTQDGSSRYEISSKEHLYQLMHDGTLYTDAGTSPSDYRSSSYIQTADIDLLGDSTNIKAIESGQKEDGVWRHFTGTYDGGLFNISNWAHNDTTVFNAAMFGSVYGGTVQNVRMTGIWTIAGFTGQAGFLSGASGGGAKFYNCEGNFDVGSSIYGGATASAGGMIATASAGVTCEGITIRGSVYMDTSTGYRGGVFSQCFATLKGIRNMANFPNNISGWSVGGISGRLQPDSMSMIQNAMSGDIVGSTYAGGIGGFGSAPTTADTVINCMTGNITSGSYAGGIWALFDGTSGTSYTKFINYMRGDVTSSNGSLGGGMFGNFQSSGTFTESINAMHGTCKDSVMGTAGATQPTTLEITVDTSFGLVYTNNLHGISTAPTTLTTNPGFTDLPYEPIFFTDTLGNSYEWEFIFANLGGNSTYSDTHLTLHTRDVILPFYAVTGILDTNTTVYLTYGNVDENSLRMDGSFTVTDSNADVVYDYAKLVVMFGVAPLLGTPSSIYMEINWSASNTYYRLDLTDSTSTVTVATGLVDLTFTAYNLLPETSYTVDLYTSSDDITYSLSNTTTITTLENIRANFDESLFLDGTDYDFESFDSTTLAVIEPLFDEIFTTGNTLKIKDTTGTAYDTSFVNLADTVDIGDSSAFYVPFDTDGQTISMTLSSSTEIITYNATNDSITVQGNEYSLGSSFKLDGKTVFVTSS